MKGKKYHLVLLAGALLAIAAICLAQAITTKDLMLAKNAQNSALTYLAGTGAVNQPPSAKSLTPDQEGPCICRKTKRNNRIVFQCRLQWILIFFLRKKDQRTTIACKSLRNRSIFSICFIRMSRRAARLVVDGTVAETLLHQFLVDLAGRGTWRSTTS